MGLIDQLSSEHGDQSTQAQAEYGVDQAGLRDTRQAVPRNRLPAGQVKTPAVAMATRRRAVASSSR
ncbi:Ltp family lipoprotein [Modestobacter italicus]|uniref:Ltp family lipoprotein n=1 Tax=Modestobacter italicus (strain DSM 44449 / CECT 9708 / BC 501) TaxID=2732864 RepID=UPI0034D3DF69